MKKQSFKLGIKRIPFNAVMRLAREKKELSQYELGKRVNISGRRIQRIETLREWPRNGEAYQLADILEVNIKVLFPKWMAKKLIPKNSNLNLYVEIEKASLSTPEVLSLPAPDNLEENLEKEFLKKTMKEALNSLSEREKKVLEMRFGLKDNKERTYEEIGKSFHRSKERIRQIEAKALRKLKHPSRKKHLEYFL